jgi:DNA-binding YbaB/EbfC family protein
MTTDFGAIMREMQNLKSRFESMQGELTGMEVSGEAGGGMVRVTLNGQFEVRKVQIEPDAMNDREMLEDLVAAALNNAVQHVREAIQARYSGLAGGLPPGLLPGL